MRKLKVYLAHPIVIRQFGIEVQRLLENLGFQVLNPFEVNEFEEEWYKAIKTGRNIASTANRLVHRDLELIRESDIVVVLNPESQGIGSNMETFYAGIILGKEVFILTLLTHPFLIECGVCVKTLDALLGLLRRRFLPSECSLSSR